MPHVSLITVSWADFDTARHPLVASGNRTEVRGWEGNEYAGAQVRVNGLYSVVIL